MKKRANRKREEAVHIEILWTFAFIIVGIAAGGFGMQNMNFLELGIIVETAVIGGVILWTIRKNNKK